MKTSVSTLLALAAAVPTAFAHYNFNALIVNGNVTDEYTYVRKNTNSNSPVTDVTSNDFRCNVGGLESGSTTQTHEVAPGDELGFTIVSSIGHPGPLQVYMSDASGDASAYDGSGDWFKVYELGTSSITAEGLQWASNSIQNFTFTLPENTPAGEYLLRVEHIALHGAEAKGGAQYYISCAQIKVTGSGAGSPSPTVSIPGVYTGSEPGIQINIYYPIPTNYTMPGPALWPSTSTEDHTVNLLGQTSDGDGSGSGSSNSSIPASSGAAAGTTAAASVAATPSAEETTGVTSAPAGVASPSGGFGGFSASSGNGTYFAPTTFRTMPSATGSVPLSTGSAGGSVAKWGQCGGSTYQGSTECASGLTCTVQNDFYSQCL